MINSYKWLGKTSLISLLILNITACLDTSSNKTRSNSSSDAQNTTIEVDGSTIAYGYYLDAAVQGVNYECGKESGVTDMQGGFRYEVGKSCTISIGNIFLREIEPDILHPNGNIYETDSTVIKLLQGLDMDRDLSNGIQVDYNIINNINQSYNNIPNDTNKLNEFMEDISDHGVALPDDMSAKNHVVTTILSHGVYKVNEDNIEKLTFEPTGQLIVEADDQVITQKSYTLDENNTVKITDKNNTTTHQTKEITQKYIKLGPDHLWYSEKLAELSTDDTLEANESTSHYIPPLDNSIINQYINAINKARSVEQDCGTHGIMGPSDPLVWSDALYSVAYEHSRDMGESNYFGHIGSGNKNDWTATSMHQDSGSSSSQRISYNGYPWYTTGENIAARVQGINNVIQLWIESDEHCVNLMSPSFTEVGMTSYISEKGDLGIYWTQVFASQR